MSSMGGGLPWSLEFLQKMAEHDGLERHAAYGLSRQLVEAKGRPFVQGS